MNFRSRHILTMIAAALALLLGACASSEAPANEGGTADSGQSVRMKLYISLDNGDASRAPADGEYDRGSGFENFIDIDASSGEGDFRVAVYNPDNKLVFIVGKPNLLPIESTLISKTYALNFEVSPDDFARISGEGSLKTFKLVILANWRHNYPSEEDFADLATLARRAATVDYSTGLPGPTLQRSDKIALFGVKQYNNIQFQTSQATILSETLHLLRAMAKVEVWENTSEVPVRISSVRLMRYNTQAAPAPYDVTDEAQYVKNSYEDDYTAVPSAPELTWEKSDTPLLLSRNADNDHFLMYMPEYLNLNGTTPRPAVERSRLFVVYEDGEEYTVEFGKYTTVGTDPSTIESYYNILRNIHYRLELTRYKHDIRVTVQVVPYAEYAYDVDFGIDSELDLVPVYDNDGRVEYWYDPNTGDYYGPDRKTKIDNPFTITTDPLTGWTLARDDNGQFVCFHDTHNHRFYGWDRKTEILQPTANVDPETGWYKIIRKSDNKILYYYDPKKSAWYKADKKTRIERPFDENDEL